MKALVSHRNHGKHRICKSLRPCWPPDEDNQRLYESAGLFVVSVRLVVEKTATLYDDDNDDDNENLTAEWVSLPEVSTSVVCAYSVN